MKNKIFILSLIGLFMITTTKAQVLWNFRVGANYGNVYDYGEEYKKDAFNFLGELGIDIPLKDKFDLEVAMRYKNVFHADSYESAYDDSYDKAYWMYTGDKEEGRTSLLEIPVKLGYKMPISDNSLVRISAGPYVSAGLHHGPRLYQAGISTAVTYEYKKVNIGLNYNLALHNAFERENANGIYLTLGIKFKSSAWKSIGTVAAVIGGTALAVGSVVAATQDGGSYENATSTNYNTYDTDNTSSNNNSKKSELDAKSKKLEKQSDYMTRGLYSADKRTYSGYESQLIDMRSNPKKHDISQYTQYKRKAKDIQKKMQVVRERIVKNGGTQSVSPLENWALEL